MTDSSRDTRSRFARHVRWPLGIRTTGVGAGTATRWRHGLSRKSRCSWANGWKSCVRFPGGSRPLWSVSMAAAITATCAATQSWPLPNTCATIGNNFWRLAGRADPADLAVLARPLQGHRPQASAALRRELAREPPPKSSATAKDTIAKQRANAGILLCLVGSSGDVWPFLAQAADPRVRTCLVHGMAAANVDPSMLVARIADQTDVSVRRAILWSLGRYDAFVMTNVRCDELSPRLAELYREDPDPGIHSATEWLLRKWGHADRIAAADATPDVRGLRRDRDWYVSPQGHSMAIIRGPVCLRRGLPGEDPDHRRDEPLEDEAIERSFAIATKEVSLRQFGLFAADRVRGIVEPRSLDSPAGRVSLLDAMAYCQWLTNKEGLGDEAMCYMPDKDCGLQVRPDWVQRTGYRLPTETEWEFACRAGTTTRRHYGHSDEYLASYAWYLANSDGLLHPCGLLLPNDLGLFDVYGNCEEWCQNRWAVPPTEAGELRPGRSFHVSRGGCDGVGPSGLTSAARTGLERITQFPFNGFRIARTISGASGKKPNGKLPASGGRAHP